MTDFLQGDKEAAAAQSKKWAETEPTQHIKNEDPPEDKAEQPPKGASQYSLSHPCDASL